MDSEKLVSVIVPVYNSAAHLGETLRSIISQDYADLEIIVVNDSSTDESRVIAESLLEESGRVFRLIDHGENLGVSAARNTGLKSAQGKYIWFCDADDIAAGNFVSELAGLSAKYDADISFGGMVNHFEDGRPDETLNVRVSSSLPIAGERALYLRMLKPIVPSICCMIFRRELLAENDLWFHEGCGAFEDIEFQMKAFCHARRVTYSRECLYTYIHSTEMGSVRDNDTHAKKLRRYIESSEAHMRTAEYLARNSPSERTRFLAENMLIPEAMIKKFTVCAMSDDREGFDSLLKDGNVRRELLRSWRVLFRKPELLMKAAGILVLPGVYFGVRKGRVR